MSNIRTTGKKTSNTLVRDLVNVGIFAALYIVLAFISSSIGYIPALIVFSTGSIALVTSIPLFLFFSKIERSILCCLIFCGFFGTAMFVMGQGVLMLTISLLVGLLAGVVLKVLGRGFAGLFSAASALDIYRRIPGIYAHHVRCWLRGETGRTCSKPVALGCNLCFRRLGRSHWWICCPPCHEKAF